MMCARPYNVRLRRRVLCIIAIFEQHRLCPESTRTFVLARFCCTSEQGHSL